MIANNGEANREWDGIWDARAVVTPEGWSVEIAIPFKTLNFDPAQTSWGFNVQRTIRRKQENIRWASARQNVRFTQVSEAGVLRGLTGLRQGLGLDVRPYGALGVQKDARGRPHLGQHTGGLDLIMNFTPSLTGVATLNTDFAETEVDARQINLTRFSLFFPEKRTFFLQNAGLFQPTGQGQRPDQPRAADLVPFFSRRIGLKADGELVPILFGAKMTGRAGPWNVGVLDVRTRAEDDVAARNFFVARVSRNLGRQSLVGGLVTHGSPEGDGRPLVGVDVRFARSTFLGRKNLILEGALFRAFADAPVGDSDDGAWALTARVDYPNDPLGINISYKQIGEAFRPGLGFVPRRGIRKGNYNIDYFQRPRQGGIRHQHWELYVETIHDPRWRLLNWRIFTAPFNLLLESGDRFEWNYIPEYEFLDAPFAIRPNVVIPPGGYVMHRYRAEVSTATRRPVVYTLSVRYGEFYGGERVETVTSVRYRPNVHVSLQLGLNRNDVRLPQGSFETSLWQGRVDVGVTPNLTVSNFLQYDTVSRIAGLNSRLRWILRPGNDLFFVVNLGLQDEGERWVSAYDRVTTKLQYTWRF